MLAVRLSRALNRIHVVSCETSATLQHLESRFHGFHTPSIDVINYNTAAPFTLVYSGANMLCDSRRARLPLFPYHLTTSDKLTLVGRLAAVYDDQIETVRCVFDYKETPPSKTNINQHGCWSASKSSVCLLRSRRERSPSSPS